MLPVPDERPLHGRTAMRRSADMSRTLYPTSGAKRLSAALFADPPAEFRGAPFWSWNGRLDRERLFEQLAVFKRMGLGGGHAHVRVGLSTEYLGEEFFGHIKGCLAEAKRLGLRLFLYDEDRWPSGSAGGIVTKDERFRMRELILAPGDAAPAKPGVVQLARYAVRLAGDGTLASWKRLGDRVKVPAKHEVWVAYRRIQDPNSWYNGQTYVDTLSVPAIEAFVATTHERYRQEVGHEFGKAIPSIFTDEPNYGHHHTRHRSADRAQQSFSWTDDLAQTFRAAYGYDLLDRLPELAWNGDGSFAVRWAYFDHISDRFAEAFAGTIGRWCDKHGILHTGHLLAEGDLNGLTTCVGDPLRSYPGLQLPGVDMLCDAIELSTVLQARSAARQYAREGVMSELYGVTGWDFDFTGHKRHGDWQAALGVTLRVHHLSWMTMAGEAKRDYPAAIDEHSPWWQRYSVVEDHFARVNTALTRGTPLCRVAVVHPIESYWGLRGPADQDHDARQDAERRFQESLRWLAHGLVDADFVSEGLLPRQQPTVKGRKLQVGAMAYDAVVLPALATIRGSTLALLQKFAAAGGTVIVLGDPPSRLDARPSPKPATVARRWTRVDWSQTALLTALAGLREVDAVNHWGHRPDNLLHQIRVDGDERHVFVCTTDRDHGTGPMVLRLRGSWDVTLMDTLDGSQRRLPAAAAAGGWTEVRADLPAAGSVLLRLAKAKKVPAAAISYAWPPGPALVASLPDPVPVTLDEPNVLLLDRAEFALDGGAWEPAEELLRVGNELRKRIGLPPMGGHMVQPWVSPRAPAQNTVRLRFTLDLTVPVGGAKLALEHAADSRLWIDGRPVVAKAEGWWVDQCIGTIALPDLAAGTRILEVEQPVGAGTALEWMYLLGDFGVEVLGARARIIAPVRSLSWGDWTRQGLPFYAGSVTYRCSIAADGGRLAVRAPRFKAPLLDIGLDGAAAQPMAFPPFLCDLGSPQQGRHELAITAYGSRVNAFSCLHHANLHNLRWIGPGAWRTHGDEWVWPWQLKPCGVLAAPELVRPA